MFSLYDRLSSELSNKDLTVLQKNDLLIKLTSLKDDGEANNLIYALIKYDFDKNRNHVEAEGGVIDSGMNSMSMIELPYDASNKDGSFEFDLLRFSSKLRQILYRFVSLYERKLKEDLDLKIIQETPPLKRG